MIIGKDFDIVEELEFKFTKEMADLVFECINIKEKIKSGKINNQEKERLEKMFIELRSKFIKEFQKINVEEIKKYNELKRAMRLKSKYAVIYCKFMFFNSKLLIFFVIIGIIILVN